MTFKRGLDIRDSLKVGRKAELDKFCDEITSSWGDKRRYRMQGDVAVFDWDFIMNGEFMPNRIHCKSEVVIMPSSRLKKLPSHSTFDHLNVGVRRDITVPKSTDGMVRVTTRDYGTPVISMDVFRDYYLDPNTTLYHADIEKQHHLCISAFAVRKTRHKISVVEDLSSRGATFEATRVAKEFDPDDEVEALKFIAYRYGETIKEFT